MKKPIVRCPILCLILCLCAGCAGLPPRPTTTSPPAPVRALEEATHPRETDAPGLPRATPIAPTIPSATAPLPSAKPEPAVFRFETKLGDTTKSRVKNIRLAADKLTGAVIAPGEEFSFNHRVGARTVKAGYRVAPIVVKGKKEKGVGGGVCQLSSTLYNAALAAGLEITERHGHTKDVGYVEEGHDATVSYGSLDLRIINNRPRSIVIDCQVIKDTVRVTLTEGE